MKYNVVWKIASIILMISTFGLLIGCGQKGLKVYPATGKVLYQNEPLGDAQISFHPKDSSGYVASAITKADGTFSLIVAGATKNGALAGEYNVLISKVVAVDKNGKPLKIEQTEQQSQAPQMDLASNHQSVQRPKMASVIPEKYAQLNKPLFQATVDKKANTYVFELEDK